MLALESPLSPTTPGPKTVSVVVQGLSPGGNVDVFAAFQTDPIPNPKCPNSTNFNAALSSTNAPPLPQVLYLTNAGGGSFYIAVTGFTAGNNLFSITVQDASPGVYVPLAAGVPAEGMLLPGAPAPTSLYTANFSLTVRAPYRACSPLLACLFTRAPQLTPSHPTRLLAPTPPCSPPPAP